MAVRLGYKQTEVGMLPEDWKVLRLGQLSEFVTSGSRGWARYYSDRGPLFIRSQNIRDGRLDFTDRQCVIPPEGSESSRTRLNCNDLLITITGNSVGNVAWVNQDLGEAYINQHVGLVRLLEPSSAEYICLFLAPGSPGNWQIWASQAGQSKPGLNLKNLEDFWVALPPLREQKAIAEALSDVDGLISALDALIAKKRALKGGAMQELLTGQRRLPGFAGEWTTYKVGDIFQFLNTANNPRSDLSDYGEVKYIHYGDIHTNPVSFLDCANDYLPSISKDKVANIPCLEDGDLVMADASEDYAGTGKSIEVRNTTGRQVVAGLHTLLLRGNKSILADGFKGYLQQIPSVKTSLIKIATGISVYGISKNNLKNIEISLPSTPEQTAIAQILADMDAELAALAQKRAKTVALKQGMMQALLTGQVRLG